LIVAVRTSRTVSDVLRKLGLKVRPGNYTTIHKYVNKLGIDTSHFLGCAHGTSVPGNKLSTDSILRKGSYYHSSDLGPRLIKEGLLNPVCSICGLNSNWNGKSLRLVLDHINGTHTDNRLSNLRLLCPNCNSQTDTFCRRKTDR